MAAQIFDVSTRDPRPLRRMWKDIFGDSDKYIDLYFSCVFPEAVTVVYEEDGVITSQLQIIKYAFRRNGFIVPAAYVSGVCTLPQYRKRGHASAIMRRALEEIRKAGYSFSFLIPSGEDVVNFYERLGYRPALYAKTCRLRPLRSIEGKSLKERGKNMRIKYIADADKAFQDAFILRENGYDGDILFHTRKKIEILTREWNDAGGKIAALYNGNVIKDYAFYVSADNGKKITLYGEYGDEILSALKVKHPNAELYKFNLSFSEGEKYILINPCGKDAVNFSIRNNKVPRFDFLLN